MRLREITAEQFAMETGKFLDQAQRSPLLVKSGKGRALVVRPLDEDDLADDLVAESPRFRDSIRRARQDRAAGKGIPLRNVRGMLDRGVKQ